MNTTDFTDFEEILRKLDDHVFWKPIVDEEEIKAFDDFISTIEDSKTWPPSRNKAKGDLLEDFAVFIFKRFVGANVSKNKRPTDNETDIETNLNDRLLPEFMRLYLSPRIICECKNKTTSAVDVGMVSKLVEILPTRGSRFGIFISLLGISGSGWRYGEGKRKKLYIKTNFPIISFKVDELNELRSGKNFYTMIKEKLQRLIDEVDDNSPDVPEIGHVEYSKRMIEIVHHFRRCEIIDEDHQKEKMINNIIERYGKYID